MESTLVIHEPPEGDLCRFKEGEPTYGDPRGRGPLDPVAPRVIDIRIAPFALQRTIGFVVLFLEDAALGIVNVAAFPPQGVIGTVGGFFEEIPGAIVGVEPGLYPVLHLRYRYADSRNRCQYSPPVYH